MSACKRNWLHPCPRPSRPNVRLGRGHSAPWGLGWPAVWLALGSACLKPLPPASQVIEEVELRGAVKVDADVVLEGLATRPSDRIFFTSGLVGEYSVLDSALLERDLERIERFYRARGYYEARIVAARVVELGNHRVRVVVDVAEGPQVLIPAASQGEFGVALTGLEAVVDGQLVARLLAQAPRSGRALDERRYDSAKRAMRAILQNAGFAFARVEGRVEVDLPSHTARIDLKLIPGPAARFGPIRLTGLESLPRLPIVQNLEIQEGDPYSESAVADARRALINLGVFSSVVVEVDRSSPDTALVPVAFHVREAPPRTLRLGGGVKLDALELATSFVGSWQHKNFLGGLRHLTVTAEPGVVLFPTRVGDTLDRPSTALPQASIRFQLQQPAVFGGRTQGFFDASFNLGPVLYTDSTTSQPLVGYAATRTNVGLERAFLGHRLHLTPSATFRAEVPFDYRSLLLGQPTQPLAEPLGTLLIAYPELAAVFDLTDDPVAPRNGFWLSGSLQAALPTVGNVRDLRLHPEARGYVTKGRSTLALRLSSGILLPGDYLDGADDPGVQLTDRELQILLFRGFFSGGPLSNRGYPFRGVGDHRMRPCARGSASDCTRRTPTGGATLWEASIEARLSPRVLSPLGLVVFLDASDVRLGRLEYRLDQPHLSPGLGVRFGTPVGPLRVDLGFRLLEALGLETRMPTSGLVFGQPLTLHLALGEAY